MSNNEVNTSIDFMKRLNDDQLRVLAYLGVVRTLRDTCEALLEGANTTLVSQFNGESDFERGVRELLCDPREEAGPRESWSSDFTLGADGSRTLLTISQNMVAVEDLVQYLYRVGIETGSELAHIFAELQALYEEGK